MARNYSSTATAIWRDKDFRALSADAQRVYMMLYSQADISAAGVVPLTLKRWASLAADTKPDDIQAAIDELQSPPNGNGPYVVVDEETEEVLVRSFVKWDGGYSNPKRQPVIIKAASAVSSEAIRVALHREFTRLGLPTDNLSHRLSDPLSDSHSNEDDVQDGGKAASPQENNLSDSQPDNHPDRDPDRTGVVVTTEVSSTQPTTPNQNQDRSHGRKRPARTLPDDWKPNDGHLQICRQRGLDAATELANFRDHAIANDRRQVDWDATFRTWLRKAKSSNLRPIPQRVGPKPPSTSSPPDGPFKFRPARPGEENRLK